MSREHPMRDALQGSARSKERSSAKARAFSNNSEIRPQPLAGGAIGRINFQFYGSPLSPFSTEPTGPLGRQGSGLLTGEPLDDAL